jgi:putative ABC transport system permease protein
LKYSFVDWGYFVYARLKDGVTLAQAQAEITTLAARMRDAHPADIGGGAIVAPLSEYLFTGHQRLFTLLLGAVALVLLIACTNVGNLLLARALERRREFVVRSALGASRGAIVRQVLAESLVVAIAGGLVGAALSPLLTRSALALLPAGNLPRLDQVRVDASVLGFTMLISILAGLLLAIIPAIRAGRGDLSLRLRSGGRGASTARSERRLSDALMVAEVALSLTLLVGAGLLTQAFLKLVRQDPGFRPEQSVAAQLSIPNYRYGAYEEGGNNFARQKLYRQLEESVGSIGGVQAEGLTVKVPMLQFWNPDSIGIEGRPPAPHNGESIMLKRWGIAESGQVDYQTVSPGYFSALRIPLIRGRLLDRQDQADAPFAAVVNQAFVRKFFADEDPIGRRIAVDRGTAFLRRMTIVGVVADARLDAMDQQALPEVFAAIAQLPSEDVWIVARASGSTDAIAIALQNTVHAIDPEIGIVQLSTMTKIVDDSLWRQRFSALLMGLFAALAAVIAAGGLYAVMSQAVERREPELGVRLALGATSGQIARIVLAHGFWISAVGLAIGGLLTMAASPLLGQQTYRLSDLLWMYAAVASFLLILTLISCWIPMRRALAVDPVATLRSE